ncbi:MAG: esterase [Acidimicrobiales bacterium]|nr:esterase [Acidimicrobiales bacterium]
MGVEVHGTVAEGFEKVADVFAANFRERGEVGAACAVRVGGEQVVDLWAGVADPATGRAYEADTLQLVFSSTKGVVAAAAHLLAQQGRLDLDAPVATYWPEFAQAGKADIAVRSLLDHSAGLVGLDEMLSVEELCDWDTVVARLAAQAPLWEPGTASGYHAITFGHLVGEVVRRVSGQDIATFVREQVAGPVGAELHIGVPAEDLDRVAPLLDFVGGVGVTGTEPDPTIAAILTPGSMTNKAFLVAPVYITSFNEPQLLQAQIPGANGCTSARSLARIYGAMVAAVDGVRLLDAAQVDDARRGRGAGTDRVMLFDHEFGSGYWLPMATAPMLGPGSFGHAGLGGSIGCALPERETGFAYVMNQCVANVNGDPRSQALLEAVLACTA